MHTTDDLIQLALKEDIGPGDITTDNLVAPETRGKGVIVAKQDLVVAGLRVADRVFPPWSRPSISTPVSQTGTGFPPAAPWPGSRVHWPPC
jgi:nicotinate-nucleotide pyrophosphorylase